MPKDRYKHSRLVVSVRTTKRDNRKILLEYVAIERDMSIVCFSVSLQLPEGNSHEFIERCTERFEINLVAVTTR